MKINRNPHGEFEFDTSYVSEHILIMRVRGPWNMQTAQEGASQLIAHSEKMKHHPWAYIEDMRYWEVCPPDVVAVFVEGIRVLLKNNFKFRAVVTDMRIQMEMVNQSVEHQSPVETENFTTPEDAMIWCRRQLKALPSARSDTL